MDLKDKRILLELDKNSRQSFSSIAKSVKLSKQAVRLRIQRLKKSIIEGYYPIINFPILGYTLYVVYLKVTRMPKNKEKIFINRINKTRGIVLNASIFGEWNFNLAVLAKDSSDFESILNHIIGGFEEYIIKKTIMIEFEAHYFKFKLFKDIENPTKIIITRNTKKRVKIDSIDKIILFELSKNARANINKMAEKIGLTSAAIIKRIKNLENKKIILGYKAQLNLGLLHAKVFLHLQKTTKEKETEIISYLSDIPEVISVSKTFGDYELEFRAIIKNILDLQMILEDFRDRYSKEFIDFSLIIFIKFHKVLSYFPF